MGAGVMRRLISPISATKLSLSFVKKSYILTNIAIPNKASRKFKIHIRVLRVWAIGSIY